MSSKQNYWMILIKMFLVILWLSNLSIAQQLSPQEPQIPFILDACQFRYSEDMTFLEFYAAIPRTALTYVPDGDQFIAEFIVTAEIVKDNTVIDSKKWRNLNHVDSLKHVSDLQRLHAINSFIVKPGPCSLRVIIEDPKSSKSSTATLALNIKSFGPADALRTSEIQLGSSIERDTTQSPYIKNGFRIIPNPTNVYGIALPVLYYYIEIYNFKPATSDSGKNYRVTSQILNSDGVMVKSFPVRERIKPGSSAVEVNGLMVVTMVSGAYVLSLEVNDHETGETVTAQKKFFIYREEDYKEGGAAFQKQEAADGLRSPGLDAERYDKLSEKELDTEFEQARYIASSKERDTYKKLNLEGKRKYIKDFWAERDPSPNTPANEFKQDYLNRVALSNSDYKGTFREGWRTDRGRVLLVYGRPDEVERFPFSNENKAYEIWHYFAIQGGVIFVFADRREMGDLELVHSTARGELYDTEWTRWISPN
jgi:GWxTD domain-containing protein